MVPTHKITGPRPIASAQGNGEGESCLKSRQFEQASEPRPDLRGQGVAEARRGTGPPARASRVPGRPGKGESSPPCGFRKGRPGAGACPRRFECQRHEQSSRRRRSDGEDSQPQGRDVRALLERQVLWGRRGGCPRETVFASDVFEGRLEVLGQRLASIQGQ